MRHGRVRAAIRPLALGYPRGVADPVADARRLLALVELLYRARVAAGLQGVRGAGDAAAELVPLGRRLRAAVEAAEAGGELDVEEVLAVGTAVWESVGPADGLRGLVGVAMAGARGERAKRPGR